jgi:hypothetical protein
MTPLCSQKNQVPQLLGTWTWLESSGGFAGKTETPETTGNIISITFSKDKYTKYLNGELNSEMTYKIEKGSSIRTEDDTYLIIYENGRKQSIELIENKLILYDECHDCYQNEYIKK